MTMENQFEVYQMRQTPETRHIRFRAYQTLLEKEYGSGRKIMNGSIREPCVRRIPRRE